MKKVCNKQEDRKKELRLLFVQPERNKRKVLLLFFCFPSLGRRKKCHCCFHYVEVNKSLVTQCYLLLSVALLFSIYLSVSLFGLSLLFKLLRLPFPFSASYLSSLLWHCIQSSSFCFVSASAHLTRSLLFYETKMYEWWKRNTMSRRKVESKQQIDGKWKMNWIWLLITYQRRKFFGSFYCLFSFTLLLFFFLVSDFVEERLPRGPNILDFRYGKPTKRKNFLFYSSLCIFFSICQFFCPLLVLLSFSFFYSFTFMVSIIFCFALFWTFTTS